MGAFSLIVVINLLNRLSMAVNVDSTGIHSSKPLKRGGTKYQFNYKLGSNTKSNGVYNRQINPKVLLICDSMGKLFDDIDVDVVSLPDYCTALDLRATYRLLVAENRTYQEIIIWVGGNSYCGNILDPKVVVEQIRSVVHELEELYQVPVKVLGLACRPENEFVFKCCKAQNDIVRMDQELHYVAVGQKLSSCAIINKNDGLHLTFYGLASLHEIIQNSVVARLE